MSRTDFVFIHKGKTVRPLSQEEAHLLSPIDETVTAQHDHALLLLHGFASSPAVFRAILPKIRGFDRIVCPALPGHGSSLLEFAQSTTQDWRHAAQVECGKLVDTYEKVSIMGLSLGGSLALELSQTFKIEHLYLLAPALKLQFPVGLARLFAQFLKTIGWKTWRSRGGDLHTNDYQEITYQNLPIDAILEVFTFIQTQTPILPNCPTDLFLGVYDKVVDVQYVAHYFAAQNNIKTHWLKNSAHILPLDGDKEELIRCIHA